MESVALQGEKKNLIPLTWRQIKDMKRADVIKRLKIAQDEPSAVGHTRRRQLVVAGGARQVKATL